MPAESSGDGQLSGTSAHGATLEDGLLSADSISEAPASEGPEMERGEPEGDRGEPHGAGREPHGARGEPRRTRSEDARLRLVLIVCCVAQFMVILDLSIVNVALPHIQAALGFSAPTLQWIVDAYSIAFAGFLMIGGRAADRYGQRRVFVAALALFALASLAGGLAGSQDMLIAARALQGFAGAFMAAASLAVITASFPPGPKLHRAIGAWAAMNGLGGAAGVLLGGIITEALSWRWVLLINPPIGVIAAFVAAAVVADRRRAPQARFDVLGALLLTLGQMILVYGVVEGGLVGWEAAKAIGPIVAGAAMLLAFGFVEARFAAAPLIPIKELTKPLKVANTIVLLFSASLFAMWFVASLYLQQVLGLSPLHTGLTFLPMTLVIMLVASRSGRLVSTYGVRPVLGTGLIMLTAGLVLLARIEPTGSGIVYIMLPGLLVAGGIGMSIVPSTIAATQGAKEGQAGLASGLVNTSRQVGGGLGLAVLITLATQRSSHLIGADDGVALALTQGFRLAFLIGAGCVAAAAIVTFTLLPKLASPATAGTRRSLRTRAISLGALAGIAAFVALDFAFASSKGAPLGSYSRRGTYSFVTAPGLHPPKLTIEGKPQPSRLEHGYILTANFYNLNEPPIVGQSGPLILDNALQPVWFRPVPEDVVASNLALQTYEGKPALSWWQGVITNTGATESGEDIVVNDHYEQVAKLRGVNGWKVTLHEMIISGHDAWVTAEKDIPMNLSPWGGAYNGALIDSAVQEYDLRTGRLIFSWNALKHIPLGDSEATIPTNGFPWDAYHINSLQLIGADEFLVSMRNTWAAYLVDMKTGKIIWTLGGRKSSFRLLGSKTEFRWQHDVRLHPGGIVTMFDDHCCQLTGGGTYVTATQPSRALELKLNEGSHTASELTQYGQGYGIESDYMGDLQLLSNGNVFVGWGSKPYLTEFTKSGEPLLEGRLPGSDLTYRATVAQWVGLPSYPPVGAARSHSGAIAVYASWNGATEVRSWRVLAIEGGAAGGASATQGASVKTIATAPWAGFETKIALPSHSAGETRFQVQALNAAGKVIGTSKPFTTSNG